MTGRRWRLLGPAAAVVVAGLAIVVLHRELSTTTYPALRHELAGLPRWRVLAALGLTALSYGCLTAYDALALRYVRHALPYGRTAFASFIGYAASNTLGFAWVTGASLRFRLYSRWGVAPGDFARIVGFYSLTMWVGALAVGGAALAFAPIPPGVPFAPGLVRLAGAGLLAVFVAYLGFGATGRAIRVRGIEVSAPSRGILAGQVVASVAEWLTAAAVPFVLLPSGLVPFPAFAGAYVVGQLLGIVSHVPGGLGIVESALLVLLAPASRTPALVGALIAFRLCYYLVPFVLAAVGLAAYEARRVGGRLAASAPLAAWARVLVPPVMAGLVFVAGGILVFSGAVPVAGSRMHWLDRTLPLAVIELSHLLASVVGVALLLLGRGLQLRLNAAFHLAMACLAAGVALSLAKGLGVEEAAALTMVLVLLWASRREFSRPSALTAERFTPTWLLAVGAVLVAATWLGFFAYRHVEYSGDLWWRFGRGAEAPRFLRATVVSSVVVVAVALGRLLRPARARPALPTPEVLDRAAAIIAGQSRAEANVVLTGDKALMFSDDGSAFLMYGVVGRSWVVMGDPVGPAAAARALIWRFRERCDAHAAWPVFYQVAAGSLPLYLDAGLTLSKIGEEARVALPEFTLEGSGRRGLRQTVRRVEREGATFAMVPAADVPALLPELARVSDEWLARKAVTEKGFSLGRFDEAYLARFPAAVVHRAGRLVAFANVWTAAPGGDVSIDLMRFADDAPPDTMEYLFVQLMSWARTSGYGTFSLGMAPLAGFEARRLSPLWAKVAGTLFLHGEHFYNFQGLKRYKEKFDPIWVPRYLASPGGLALPRVVADVTALIAGGWPAILRR